MTKKLEWNVFRTDFNHDDIVYNYNIFYDGFVGEIKKEKIADYSQLKHFIKHWAMYHYWSKVEYEMIISGVVGRNKTIFNKVDVYDQIEMNLDRICEYVNRELKIVKE